ncbi:MAG: tetratricopeptide repeat protein [Planctomycetaceae bacterium]|jgi:tetratricopeptide (TPR) repeat protein|nr:tetratricopeptide repeat protein [Planctomycetaceae bacterium]
MDERLQQLFTCGNEQMTKGNYEYADNIYFSECVLGDPGNPLYFKTFLANLRKKYGDKKRKGGNSLLTRGKKAAVSTSLSLRGSEPQQRFKAGIEALRHNPWDVQALLETGDTCEKLKHFDVAVEYYRTAVETEPDNIEANTVCASALKNIADYEGALACVNRVLKVRPTDHDILLLRQELTVDMTIHRGKYRSGDAGHIKDAAAAAIPDDEDAMGRHLTVPQQIERRIKRHPADLANYLELAQYYYQISDLTNVEEVLTRAVKISENEPSFVERLLDAQKRRLQQEVVELKTLYEQEKSESVKETFLVKRNEYEAKKRELTIHRIEMNPNHSGYRYDYGLLLIKDGKIKEAITEFQTAKAETAVAGDCLFALGQCFQLIKQYKLAMTHYREAVEKLEAGESKKKALYQTVKLAAALKDYETAEKYGHQLAAMDYGFRDIAALLNQIAEWKRR